MLTYMTFRWAKAKFSGTTNTSLLDVIKCTLNSDVLFKGMAQMIETLQTKNSDIINGTRASLQPSMDDECKKCLMKY